MADDIGFVLVAHARERYSVQQFDCVLYPLDTNEPRGATWSGASLGTIEVVFDDG